MEQDQREDGVQEALDMLLFMGLKCDICYGQGWYEDIEAYHNGMYHCEQQVQRQCENATGLVNYELVCERQ